MLNINQIKFKKAVNIIIIMAAFYLLPPLNIIIIDIVVKEITSMSIFFLKKGLINSPYFEIYFLFFFDFLRSFHTSGECFFLCLSIKFVIIVIIIPIVAMI